MAAHQRDVVPESLDLDKLGELQPDDQGNVAVPIEAWIQILGVGVAAAERTGHKDSAAQLRAAVAKYERLAGGVASAASGFATPVRPRGSRAPRRRNVRTNSRRTRAPASSSDGDSPEPPLGGIWAYLPCASARMVAHERRHRARVSRLSPRGTRRRRPGCRACRPYRVKVAHPVAEAKAGGRRRGVGRGGALRSTPPAG